MQTFLGLISEGAQMAILRRCKLYQDEDTESLNEGRGSCYCELDGAQTTCNGDIDSCRRTDSLKRYFFEQIRRAGGFEWENRINALFPEDA